MSSANVVVVVAAVFCKLIACDEDSGCVCRQCWCSGDLICSSGKKRKRRLKRLEKCKLQFTGIWHRQMKDELCYLVIEVAVLSTWELCFVAATAAQSGSLGHYWSFANVTQSCCGRLNQNWQLFSCSLFLHSSGGTVQLCVQNCCLQYIDIMLLATAAAAAN